MQSNFEKQRIERRHKKVQVFRNAQNENEKERSYYK